MASIHRLFAAVRDLPPALRVVAFVFFAAGFADGILLPFFAVWAVRDASVPVAATGALLACAAGGELLATPLAGGLSDRIGRRPVLVLSAGGIGAGFLLLSASHGVIAVGLSLLLLGAFESVLHPTAMAVVADLAPPSALRRHFGINRMAGSAGDLLGPASGALIATCSPGSVFLAAAAAMLAASAAVAWTLPETRPGAGPGGEEEDEEEDPGSGVLGLLWRDRRLGAVLLPFASIQLASSWFETVLPLAATARGVLSPSGVGLLFSYSGLLGLALQMTVLRVSDAIGAARAVLVAGVLLSLSFALLLVCGGVAGPVLAATGSTLAAGLLGPTVGAAVTGSARADRRAAAAAALSVVQDLRDAAGPAIGTPLLAIAAPLPWAVGLVLTASGAAALASALRRSGRSG